jgi:hypothetical protein
MVQESCAGWDQSLLQLHIALCAALAAAATSAAAAVALRFMCTLWLSSQQHKYLNSKKMYI